MGVGVGGSVRPVSLPLFLLGCFRGRFSFLFLPHPSQNLIVFVERTIVSSCVCGIPRSVHYFYSTVGHVSDSLVQGLDFCEFVSTKKREFGNMVVPVSDDRTDRESTSKCRLL